MIEFELFNMSFYDVLVESSLNSGWLRYFQKYFHFEENVTRSKFLHV